MNGKNISDIDFFAQEKNGKKEWLAAVYFKTNKSPVLLTKKDALPYLEAVAEANGIDPKSNTAIKQLQEKKLFHSVSIQDAKARFDFINLSLQKKKADQLTKKAKPSLAKRAISGVVIAGAALITILSLRGCSIKKNEKVTNSQSYSSSQFDQLLAQLSEGTKKTAVSKVQTTLKSFNDRLSPSIMKDGEDRLLAHSWDENIAAYLAFNDFTDEQLFEIFDTYKIDGNELYDLLKLSNSKEMLYYARATEPSGRGALINSEKGQAFFNKYEELIINFNLASTKEDKVAIAKQFYAMVREDFPIQSEDQIGFIHTDKGYEDYAYAVTPMISAMEVMTRNIGVNLNNTEIKYFNELGMCNFAQEKLARYQSQLEQRQSIEIAKDELRAEYEVKKDADGKLQIQEIVPYEELREAGIASVDHYDLSEEKNDVGLIEGWWDSATVDTIGKQAVKQSASKGRTTTTTTTPYKKQLTEAEVAKQSPAIQQEVQKQKDAINAQIAEENAKAKQESDRKKAELEKQIQEEKKKLEEQVEKDNAWMNDHSSSSSSSSSGSSDSEAPKRPTVDDVDPHIDVDDQYVDEDGNLKFDGPIYDSEGNIIDNPSAKATKKTATFGTTTFVVDKSGLYVPVSAEDVNNYVNGLANPTSVNSVNTANSSKTK